MCIHCRARNNSRCWEERKRERERQKEMEGGRSHSGNVVSFFVAVDKKLS